MCVAYERPWLKAGDKSGSGVLARLAGRVKAVACGAADSPCVMVIVHIVHIVHDTFTSCTSSTTAQRSRRHVGTLSIVYPGHSTHLAHLTSSTQQSLPSLPVALRRTSAPATRPPLPHHDYNRNGGTAEAPVGRHAGHFARCPQGRRTQTQRQACRGIDS